LEKWRQVINNAAVITAAGNSVRTGSGIKKEFRLIDNKPVLVHAVLPFLETGLFNYLIITMSPAQIEKTRKILDSYMKPDKITVIPGGETRQKSVLKGLESLINRKPEYVLIHDGARPWISAEIIKSVFEKTVQKRACVPVIKARDAVKSIKNSEVIENHLDREKIYCAQTPQGFIYSEILEAHKRALSENLSFIDDSEIYSRYIGPVYIVEGDVRNSKITYKYDLESL
jgi:2-C-methyl-D-erythritol 4-phosphate cytidylyltransferase/2-C-methyl-D-erythritol 4-phosphate cytidylyltransferase/2-C-methyl-D-erythritol 2,4-cyclodiphosphate synthase